MENLTMGAQWLILEKITEAIYRIIISFLVEMNFIYN